MLDENTNTNAGFAGTTAPEQQENGTTAQTAEAEKTTEVVETKPEAEVKTENEGKKFGQDEVNAMVSDRVKREKESFCKKLGIEKYEDLEAYVAKCADNETKLADLTVKNSELVKDYALLKNGIDPARYEDVAIYFKGKGVALDSETLAQEITTHPEWVKKEPTPSNDGTTIVPISPKRDNNAPVETEEQRKDREFGPIR